MGKVYDETERNQLLKLNHCLTDLMTMIRADIDRNSIMTVKRMIQAFVAEATGVLKVVEAKSGRPVQEGFFDRFKKDKSNPTPSTVSTTSSTMSNSKTKRDFCAECYKYAYSQMPDDLKSDITASENAGGRTERYIFPKTDQIPELEIELNLNDWSTAYVDAALADQNDDEGDDSWETAIKIFNERPYPYIELGGVYSETKMLDKATIEFSLVDKTVYLRPATRKETALITLAQTWGEFKSHLEEIKPEQEGFFDNMKKKFK